jgi:asparagine synthase (glutamine-hydrolysing)
MCGIAGVVAWDEKYRITRDTLTKMSAAIAHRGPDGEGFHLTRENEPITPDTPQVGLAFRRLAVLDPDPRSNQPFHIGPLSMVFNGEIYNFRDLKSEISNLRPAYQWRTTGDTEVLLMAYELWREKCVEKLNGMFAIAIWDEQKKELFLARDRMGQKPLYVAVLPSSEVRSTNEFDTLELGGEPSAIAFGSEVSTLTLHDWVDRTIDDRGLLEYLRWGCVPNPLSIYNGVFQLAPSGFVQVTTAKRRPSFGTYFDRNQHHNPQQTDDRQTAHQYVLQAVHRQLVSDVPLGCFLSGGIDSSVVAACARSFGEVQTFSIGFDDRRYDESSYAEAVASHLQTRHRRFMVRPDAVEDLPKLARVFGEPFGDSSALPTHYLSRETRNHVTVALSGDGGDELFGGYDRYRAMNLEKVLRRVPRFVRNVVAGPVTEQLPPSHPKSVRSQMKRFLKSVSHSPCDRYASYLKLFDDDMGRELLSKSLFRSPFHDRFDGLAKKRDVVQAALAVDRLAYLPDDLLTKVDRCSMLHALEVRSPFMDHELVQFAAGLTTDQLLKGGPKRMLREAFAKDLPEFVFKRKKMGFAVPIGEWFRGELRPMLRDNLFASDSFARSHFNMKVVERLVEEHEHERVDHSQRLYALLMLELWWRNQKT